MNSLPVHVLTGFLGSGKTTLLKHLLASPEFAETAVLINEFGDVAIDHVLVEPIAEDIVLLPSGCVCCTIRGDLSRALLDLYSRRDRDLVPRFARMAIETTGLADPTPILATLLHDPILRHHLHPGNVIATIDAVNGLANLDEYTETVRQAAIADRLVITKCDLVAPSDLAALHGALERLNPAALVLQAAHGDVDIARLFGEEAWHEETRSTEARGWLRLEGQSSDVHDHASAHGHARPGARHASDIRAFCITLEAPVDWVAFGLWLTLLLHRHGNDILRVKGILRLTDSEFPVVVQGVQHLVHTPTHLASWPFADQRSRLVFIARGLDASRVEASLKCFDAIAGGREEEVLAGRRH
jgi:G3E family GTPase